MSNLTQQPFILDLNHDELRDLFTSLGEPAFRADQVWQALYSKFAEHPDQISTLSKDLRTRLASTVSFSHLNLVTRLSSKDGSTVKTLFRLPDGNTLESVLMRYEERNTLCISSQSGCAMGCVFCATGQMGFARNLSSGEIVEQVLFFARELAGTRQVVTNIVVMGMGEPFHNYDAVLKAIACLNDPRGFNLGARRFTISTVGIVPMIRRFADEKNQVNLAISLHSANDNQRGELLPVNRKYPIKDLIDACRYYVETTHRRITFEWALIQDVNDFEKDAQELSSLIKGLLCHVNIIPLNPTSKFSGKSTTHERALSFQAVLAKNGIPCTIRLRRGLDINAGCGQLASSTSDVAHMI
jgi:23S rRNA (adenine2503-C2)-methyltransferase